MPDGIDPAIVWLVAALLLGGAELLVPGVFLVFLAIGAALTAGLAFAVPDAPLAAQFASFGVWSAAAVLVGRRWYRDFGPESGDAKLNDRAARMIGEVVTVEVAIEYGRGRVRVGDGAWPAEGPDLAAGDRARIVKVKAGVLVVEPLTP
jgi:membrane protein implicated in regulation of membrane protease activity